MDSAIPRLLPIAVLACCSATADEAFATEDAALGVFLEEARAAMAMPGLRAAIRYPDGRIRRAATGLADVEAGTPLDNDVGMPGGSTGKTFAAALAMLLVEDQVLILDDPVGRWLAGTAWFDDLPSAEHMRIHHLLSHSSGISDYPQTFGYRISSVWRAVRRGGVQFEPEELIAFATTKEPLFPVGEGFRYTDAGYLVLGRAMEAATGRTYFDLLRERILKPQGLDQVRPQDRAILADITPGYTFGARNLRDDGSMKIDPSSEWTGGGLVTTPTMLVRFHAALAAGDIVQPASFAAMVDGGWRDPATPGEHYGFGLFVHNGGAQVSHGGLWPGYRTHVVHDLESGLTIAVQTNRDGRVDMAGLAERLADQFGQ